MNDTEMYRKFLKAYWWEERDKVQTDRIRRVPPPLPQKPVPPGVSLIGLVTPGEMSIGKMPVIEAIRKRKSHRRFTGDPLSLEELSFLAWSTQGLRDREGRGSISRRTVPSAGARHPFETYLLINRVEGIQAGIYRYLPLEHSLYLLYTDPDLPGKVSEGCRGQEFVGEGAVVFIWTVIPYRMEWRYLMVSPKMIALDAGHLCQNLYIACESIATGTCAIGAYDQDKMDALLKVDGREEFVIYAAPVGKV